MGRKKKELPKRVIMEYSPAMADKTWGMIKDIASNRAKELENDEVKTRRIFELAESAKREFVLKNFPVLMDGETVLADDVLAVLTTMTLMIATEMFENNDDMMAFIKAPIPTGVKPYHHKDGNPLYV